MKKEIAGLLMLMFPIFNASAEAPTQKLLGFYVCRGDRPEGQLVRVYGYFNDGTYYIRTFTSDQTLLLAHAGRYSQKKTEITHDQVSVWEIANKKWRQATGTSDTHIGNPDAKGSFTISENVGMKPEVWSCKMRAKESEDVGRRLKAELDPTLFGLTMKPVPENESKIPQETSKTNAYTMRAKLVKAIERADRSIPTCNVLARGHESDTLKAHDAVFKMYLDSEKRGAKVASENWDRLTSSYELGYTSLVSNGCGR